VRVLFSWRNHLRGFMGAMVSTHHRYLIKMIVAALKKKTPFCVFAEFIWRAPAFGAGIYIPRHRTIRMQLYRIHIYVERSLNYYFCRVRWIVPHFTLAHLSDRRARKQVLTNYLYFNGSMPSCSAATFYDFSATHRKELYLEMFCTCNLTCYPFNVNWRYNIWCKFCSCVVTPCGRGRYCWHFGGTCCFHLQGRSL
jgi:hypothetical protein